MGSLSGFLGCAYFCVDLEGLRERENFSISPCWPFPTFTGESTRMLSDLEMALLAFGQDEDEIKLKAFPLVLKDEAKTWFQGLPVAKKVD